MKVAILISGEPRFGCHTNTIFDTFNKSENDWFFYLWKSSPFGVSKNYVAECWNNFQDKWAREKIKSLLPENNRLKRFKSADEKQFEYPYEVLNCPEDNSDRIYKMYSSIHQTDLMRRKCGHYDLVVRCRPDINLMGSLDLEEIKRTIDEDPNIMYFPTNQHWGYDNLVINDMFAIGSPKTMEIYCDIVKKIPLYNLKDNIKFHPETLLRYHLDQNNIKVVNCPINVQIRNDNFGSWA